MSIYTKKGDKGATRLCDGLAVGKDDLRIEAIGTVDELNAILGVVRAQKFYSRVKDNLIVIQDDLRLINARLARCQNNQTDFLTARIDEMEKIIDEISDDLPKLDHFLTPGVNLASSYLHLARSVARKAERTITRLAGKETIKPDLLSYFNRLSDLLFVFAYWCEQKL